MVTAYSTILWEVWTEALIRCGILIKFETRLIRHAQCLSNWRRDQNLILSNNLASRTRASWVDPILNDDQRRDQYSILNARAIGGAVDIQLWAIWDSNWNEAPACNVQQQQQHCSWIYSSGSAGLLGDETDIQWIGDAINIQYLTTLWLDLI